MTIGHTFTHSSTALQPAAFFPALVSELILFICLTKEDLLLAESDKIALKEVLTKIVSIRACGGRG